MSNILSIIYRVFLIIIILLTSPVLVLVAISIVLTSGFPIFFLQKRVGKYGNIFVLYKFRTMHNNAEEEKKSLQKYNEAHGPVFKIHEDPRFTPIGRLLSHTGLDELPQLFNVLEGTMSLFGPRPLPIEEAKHLKTWQQQRHTIHPGIVSPWILEGYHETTFDSWMRSDITYIQKKSLSQDMRLFTLFLWYWIRLGIRELYILPETLRSNIDKKKKKQYT